MLKSAPHKPAMEDYKRILKYLLKDNYKIIEPSDAKYVIIENRTKQGNPYYEKVKIIDFRVKVLIDTASRKYTPLRQAYAGNYESPGYESSSKQDDEDFAQIYIIKSPLGGGPNKGPFAGPYGGEFLLLKKIDIVTDQTIVEVSEDHYMKFGGTIVKKAYVPVRVKDFASSDTMDTFGDLMGEL
jgi:hypothetical protein